MSEDADLEAGAADAAPDETIATTTPTEGQEGAASPPAEGEGQDPAPQRKSAEAQLRGRVGHLTKTLHSKDAEIEELQRRYAAAQQLLDARGAEGGAEGAPSNRGATPAPGTPEFDRLVDERASVKAREAQFNADCNRIFEDGQAAYGQTWKESVDTLNAMGVMRPELIEAAMASGHAAKVLHQLGGDPDEAARIASLSPIRMAAEMTKLAAQGAQPIQKEAGKRISEAPPPIKPVGGAVNPVIDVYADDLSMSEYVRRRKAMGSPWAR